MNISAFSWWIMFLIQAQICSAWDIDERPFPQPTGGSQMIFNNVTSTVYIFGGFSLNKSEIVFSTKIYKRNINNKSSVWSELDIKTPSDCFLSQIQNSVTIDDMVYFIGINNGSYTTNQIWLFNITTDQFITNHSIPKYKYPACSGCLVTNNTHILMVGGVNAPGNTSLIRYIQILNIKTNSWTYQNIDLPFISLGWSHQICNLINNTLYTFGGVIEYPQWKSTNVIYKYDLLSSNWQFIGYLSHWTSQAWSVYSAKYNNIYVITPEAHMGNVTLSVFHVKEEKIIFKSQLFVASWQTPMLLYNDTITIFGGYGFYYGSVFSQLIQIAKLPLITQKSSSSKQLIKMSTGLFIGVISISSIISVLIGCIVGFVSCRYIIKNENHGNVNLGLDASNHSINQYGALDGIVNDENSPSHRVM